MAASLVNISDRCCQCAVVGGVERRRVARRPCLDQGVFLSIGDVLET